MNTFNLDAERSVLGAIFLDNHSIDNIPYLSAIHFSRQEHADIFSGMLSLWGKGNPVDAVSIKDACGISSDLINNLIDQVPTSSNIGYYAKQVMDCYTARRILESADNIRGIVANGSDIKNITDEAESAVFAIRDQADTSDGVEVRGALKSAMNEIERRYHNKGKMLGS